MKQSGSRDRARIEQFEALLKWVAGDDMPEAEARSFEAALDSPDNEILKTLREVNEATQRFLRDPAGQKDGPASFGKTERRRRRDDERGDGRF